MKTVLILANASDGLYDFRNELLLRLLAGYRVVVSVPDQIRSEDLAIEGCEVIHTPMNRRGMNPLEDAGLFRSYYRLIKSIRPDLVLTYTIKPNIYGSFCCRLLKIPYMVTITGIGTTFQRKGFIKTLIIMLYRMGLKKAACIFFQNEANQKIFEQEKISGKKIKMVHGSGVNIRRHRMEPYPKGEEFRFLFIGRLMRDKGIEEYLAAAKVLHNEKIKFQIVGEFDEDYQELVADYERQGVITFYGVQKEVNEFYAQASAVVLPSYHEGMSNVLMEASATGRPVIASNISGCREIFDERETGIGFKPGDTQDLIRALQEFMAIPYAERALMGRKAREKMGREFDREKIVDAYMEEIVPLLTGQNGGRQDV